MLIAGRSRGFTIIELMIGVALLALLLMLAMPAFTTMLQNARLRAVSESVLTGLQQARAEALKRNQPVEFLLTGTNDPDDANYTGLAADTNGPAWVVRVIDGVPTGVPIAFVEGRVAGETAVSGTQVTGNYPAPPPAFAAYANRVLFDPLGRAPNLSANATILVDRTTAAECKANGGPITCLRIVVTPGGRVRMCDPTAGANDTRAC